jgi:hypothetical protein
MPVAFLAGGCNRPNGSASGDYWDRSNGVPMGLLVFEAARAIRRGVRRYGVLLAVYLAYVFVLRPIAQNLSAPAASVLGAGACYSSSGTASGAAAAAAAVSSQGGLIVSAVLGLLSLPVWLMGWLKAEVCKELRIACAKPPYGFWWPQDCAALFQQPPGLG